MHELSLLSSVVENIESAIAKESEPIKKVLTVSLLVGDLSGVEIGALEFAFPEAIRESSLLKEANLKIERSALKVICQNNGCHKESFPEPTFLVCPYCGQMNVQVISGKEFKILDLEVL